MQVTFAWVTVIVLFLIMIWSIKKRSGIKISYSSTVGMILIALTCVVPIRRGVDDLLIFVIEKAILLLGILLFTLGYAGKRSDQ